MLAALAVLTIAGCAAGPDYKVPQPQLPAAWTGGPAADATEKQAALEAAWWQRFGDPLLTRLVERALVANTDLRQAQAALRQARASRDVARAAFAPSVTASATAARSSGGGSPGSNHFAAGFDAAWELDLFGGLRRGAEAADADLQSAAASLESTRVSLAAEAARNYVELRAYQLRIAIAQANLASQSETLQLTDWRAQSGLVGSLDVEQARANREQTRAQIPALASALAASRHALALLLNEPPAALDAELGAAPTPQVPQADARVAIGIPADVLRQRPDVVAAERSLAAATARIGVAEAARWPALSLSGSIGLDAARIGDLTGSGALSRSLVGALAAPIFDAGRLRAQVEIQEAAQEQALAAYEATVIGALRDVEDALSALAAGRERAAALAQAVEAARNAALLARYRYSSGLTDFQTVLDTERTVRTIEDSVATTEADNATALIQLFKALGGGWSVAAADGTR